MTERKSLRASRQQPSIRPFGSFALCRLWRKLGHRWCRGPGEAIRLRFIVRLRSLRGQSGYLLRGDRGIILYTGYWYDEFIERYTSRYSFQDLTSKENQIQNGQKMIGWWERDCFVDGVRQFQLLRTS